MIWPHVRLGEVATIQGGIQKQPKRAPRENTFPFLRVANVAADGLDLRDIHSIEVFEGELSRYRLEVGDLLVVEGNGSASQIGRAAVWNGSIPDTVHQNHLIRVRPGPRLDPHYLGLAWNSPRIRDELTSVSSSTSGLHTLSVAKLKRIPIPLPGLREQRRIVEILEDHLSHLDAGNGYLCESAARGAAVERSFLAELHDGPATALRLLARDSGYGTSAKCVEDGPGVAVVRIPNLVGGRVDLTDEKRIADPSIDVSRSMLTPGDLLIVRTNGSVDLIGKSAVVQGGVDAAFASYLIRYRFRADAVRPAWVQAMLSTPQLREKIESLAASSAGQHNLSLTKLDPLPIPVPSLGVQDASLGRLKGVQERMRILGADVTRGRQRSAALRRALLSAAFSGRLTGRHADQEVIEELAT